MVFYQQGRENGDTLSTPARKILLVLFNV